MTAYTTTLLLENVSRRSAMPTGQDTYDNDAQLAIGDDVLDTYLIPDIYSRREDFFTMTKTYTITSGQSEYLIPSRAVGMNPREVQIQRSGSSDIFDIPQTILERAVQTTSASPYSFYLKDDKVVLYPTPNSTGDTLLIHYTIKHSKLVTTSETGIITDISGASVTVGSIPSSWTTGDTFDFIKGYGAHRFVDVDLESTLVSGSIITFAEDVSDVLQVGDYVALQGETSLIQLPPDYRATLAQGIAWTMLESMGLPLASKAEKSFQSMRESCLRLLTPRVVGEEKTFIGATKSWGI